MRCALCSTRWLTNGFGESASIVDTLDQQMNVCWSARTQAEDGHANCLIGKDLVSPVGIAPARNEPASCGVTENDRGEPIRIEMRLGEPGRNRTYNQQIKSLW